MFPSDRKELKPMEKTQNNALHVRVFAGASWTVLPRDGGFTVNTRKKSQKGADDEEGSSKCRKQQKTCLWF